MSDSIKLFDDQIQVYLDDVAAVLRNNGTNDEDVASICDGLKAQIFEMATQAGTATEKSVAQVIAAMDDPKHFATSAERASKTGGSQAHDETSSVVASIGFYVAVTGPVLAIVSGVIASMLYGNGSEFGSFILFAAVNIALIFGIISYKEPRGRTAILVALGTIVGYFVLIFVALSFDQLFGLS